MAHIGYGNRCLVWSFLDTFRRSFLRSSASNLSPATIYQSRSAFTAAKQKNSVLWRDYSDRFNQRNACELDAARRVGLDEQISAKIMGVKSEHTHNEEHLGLRRIGSSASKAQSSCKVYTKGP